MKYIIGILMIVILLMAGCIKQEVYVQEPEAPSTENQEVETTTETRSNVVEVVMTEWDLELDVNSVETGNVRFRISNNAEIQLEFAIRGENTSTELQNALPPGETAELVVELEEGTYTLYDPIPSHEAKGMVAQLIVE